MHLYGQSMNSGAVPHHAFEHGIVNAAGRGTYAILTEQRFSVLSADVNGADEQVDDNETDDLSRAGHLAEHLLLGQCDEHERSAPSPDARASQRINTLLRQNEAALRRVAEGLRFAAGRPRVAGELVSLTRDEVIMLVEGRDGLEEAVPNCSRCLVPMDVHPTADAWQCPSCGNVRLV